MMRLLVAILFFCSSSAFGIDTSIRVLGMYPQGASIGVDYMRNHLNGISSAWNATGMNSISGISVEILNGGVAVTASLPGMPTTDIAVADWAYSQPGLISVRNAWSADIVVLFNPYTDPANCGATRARFLAGNFLPDAQGMDLRWRNDAFVTVVPTGCVGLPSGAHEFGHIFGAGHQNSASSARLYSDSRAFSTNLTLPTGGFRRFSTTMGDRNECPAPCIIGYVYSKNGQYGDGSRQNARTLNVVAKSIANYIGAPTPPTPILNPPINVTGFLITACMSPNQTRHQVFWNDDPQTNVAVSTYQIWYSQPPGQPYVYGWSLPYTQKFSDAYIGGANSQIRVKACTTSQCSALSASSYLAEWACNM